MVFKSVYSERRNRTYVLAKSAQRCQNDFIPIDSKVAKNNTVSLELRRTGRANATLKEEVEATQHQRGTRERWKRRTPTSRDKIRRRNLLKKERYRLPGTGYDFTM